MLFWDKYSDSWFISLFRFHSISYSVRFWPFQSHQPSRTHSRPCCLLSADWSAIFSTEGSLQLDKSNATALQCFSNWRIFIKEEYERRSNYKRVESISAVISTYASQKTRWEWCQAPSSNVWLIDRRSGTSNIIKSPGNPGYNILRFWNCFNW